MCAGVELRAGSHFVEFVWVSGRARQRGSVPAASSQHATEALGLHDPDDEDDAFLVGVCRPNFDPTDGGMACNDSTASMFSAASGRLREETEDLDWPGQQRAAVGDVIGLLLDLDEGSLAVYPLLRSFENLYSMTSALVSSKPLNKDWCLLEQVSKRRAVWADGPLRPDRATVLVCGSRPRRSDDGDRARRLRCADGQQPREIRGARRLEGLSSRTLQRLVAINYT